MLGGKPSGGVSSRFVSQAELEEAAKIRASTGPADKDDKPYDPRSLFEQLQAHKTAKDEEYDDMYKLSNQFRGIDEGESEFLSEVSQRRAQEERRKRQQEEEELQRFRQARHTSTSVETALSLTSRPSEGPTELKPAAQSSKVANETSTASATAAQITNNNTSNKKKRKAAGSSLLGIVRKKTQPTLTSVAAKPPATTDSKP